MKLIGSSTEQEIRTRLLGSKEELFTNPKNRNLLQCLIGASPNMKTAFVLYWIPEQGEDIYQILVNDDLILEIEISHDGIIEEPVKSYTISQYLVGKKRMDQIKLAVALDLAKRDLK